MSDLDGKSKSSESSKSISNGQKVTKPLIERYMEDETLVRRIKLGQFDLFGPKGSKTLPEIWPHSIRPGDEVDLLIRQEQDEPTEEVRRHGCCFGSYTIQEIFIVIARLGEGC